MSQIEFPVEWEKTHLGDDRYFQRIGGKTPLKSRSDYWDNGTIPWVSGEDIDENGINLLNTTMTKITRKALEEKAALLVPEKSVIVSCTATIGKVGITEEPMTTNQQFNAFVIKKEFDARFLAYYLLASKNELKKLAKTTTFPHIIIPRLNELPKPDVITQKKIVQKLDYVLGQLDEEKEKISQLQDPKKILRFNESLKYHILLQLRVGKLSNGNWSKYERKLLGKITDVTSGGTPSRTVGDYWNGDIPWIKSGELVDGDIKDSEEHITKEGLENSSAKLFPPNTILVALYGQGQTRGRTARLLCEATTNQACCAVLPKPSMIYPRYLQYWIRGLYWELRTKALGGAQPNWNSTTIKNIEIVLPPITDQKSMTDKLDSRLNELEVIESTINQITKKRKKISEYFNNLKLGILEKAFSGKLIN